MIVAILLFIMSGIICAGAWVAMWFAVKILDGSDE